MPRSPGVEIIAKARVVLYGDAEKLDVAPIYRVDLSA